MTEKVPRNRGETARARGKRQVYLEVNLELDESIDRVRELTAAELGGCTRQQAIVRMILEGAKKILAK